MLSWRLLARSCRLITVRAKVIRLVLVWSTMGVADGAAVTPERIPYDGRAARHFAICGVYLELRRGTANGAVHPLPLSLSLPFLVLALVALSSWLCGLGPARVGLASNPSLCVSPQCLTVSPSCCLAPYYLQLQLGLGLMQLIILGCSSLSPLELSRRGRSCSSSD